MTLAELPESPTAAGGHEGSPGPLGTATATGSAEKAGASAAAAPAAGVEGAAEADAEGEGAGEEGEEAAAGEALAWLPATLASLGLRLQALDAALVYSSSQPAAREQLEVGGSGIDKWESGKP